MLLVASPESFCGCVGGLNSRVRSVPFRSIGFAVAVPGLRLADVRLQSIVSQRLKQVCPRSLLANSGSLVVCQVHGLARLLWLDQHVRTSLQGTAARGPLPLPLLQVALAPCSRTVLACLDHSVLAFQNPKRRVRAFQFMPRPWKRLFLSVHHPDNVRCSLCARNDTHCLFALRRLSAFSTARHHRFALRCSTSRLSCLGGQRCACLLRCWLNRTAASDTCVGLFAVERSERC